MKSNSIENFETRQNYEYYKKILESSKTKVREYKEKDYPRNFTMNDKKIVDKRYA